MNVIMRIAHLCTLSGRHPAIAGYGSGHVHSQGYLGQHSKSAMLNFIEEWGGAIKQQSIRVSKSSGHVPLASEVGAAGEVERAQAAERAQGHERGVEQAVAVAQVEAGEPVQARERRQAGHLAAALQVDVLQRGQACAGGR